MTDITLDTHRAAEGIDAIGATATPLRLVPARQQLSLLTMAANSVLAAIEEHRGGEAS